MVRMAKGDGAGMACRGYQVASVAPPSLVRASGLYSVPWINTGGTVTTQNMVVEDTNANPDKFYVIVVGVSYAASYLGGGPAAQVNYGGCSRGLRVTEGSTIDYSGVFGLPAGTVTFPCSASSWTAVYTAPASGAFDGTRYYAKIVKGDRSTVYGNQETGNRFFFDNPAGFDDAIQDLAGFLALAAADFPGYAGIGTWVNPATSPGDQILSHTWGRAENLSYPSTIVAGVPFDVYFDVVASRTGVPIDITGFTTPDPISIDGYPETSGVNAYYNPNMAGRVQTSAGHWHHPDAQIFVAGLQRIGASSGVVSGFDVAGEPTKGDPILVVPAAPSKMRLAAGRSSDGFQPVTGGRPRIYRPGLFFGEGWNTRELTGVNKAGSAVTRVLENIFAAIRLQDKYGNDCGDECPDTPITVELVDTDPSSTAVPGRLAALPPTPGMVVSTLSAGGALIDTGRERDVVYAPAPGKLVGISGGGPADGADTFAPKVTFTLGDVWPKDGRVVIDFPPLKTTGASSAGFTSATGADGGFSIVAESAGSVTLLRDGSGTDTPADTAVAITLSNVKMPVTESFLVTAKKGLAVFDNIRIFGLSYTFVLRFSSPGLAGLDVYCGPGIVLQIDAPKTCVAGETITVTVRAVDYGGNLIDVAPPLDPIYLFDGTLHGSFAPAASPLTPSSGVAVFSGAFPAPGRFNLEAQSSFDRYVDIGWLSADIVVTP